MKDRCSSYKNKRKQTRRPKAALLLCAWFNFKRTTLSRGLYGSCTATFAYLPNRNPQHLQRSYYRANCMKSQPQLSRKGLASTKRISTLHNLINAIYGSGFQFLPTSRDSLLRQHAPPHAQGLVEHGVHLAVRPLHKAWLYLAAQAVLCQPKPRKVRYLRHIRKVNWRLHQLRDSLRCERNLCSVAHSISSLCSWHDERL